MQKQAEANIKGKAIKVEADTKPPTPKDVRAMQALAKRVSPEMLALLEAETKQNG